jgi:hypothetical protein
LSLAVSIFHLTPMEVVVIGVIIGIAFVLPLTVDEDAVFGNVLSLAAEMVFIVAAQRVLFSNLQATAQTEQAAASADNLQRQLDDLTDKVAKRAARLKMSSVPQPAGI